jgi:Fe-S cluster biogenesis protein NfuA
MREPELPTSNPTSNSSDDAAGAALRARVERVLGLIRPAIQEDGGDVELVSASAEGLVRIKFHGACVGCPSAHLTLHHGIERALRTELGDGIRVEAVAAKA